MMVIKVKFWKGWVTTQGMSTPGWYDEWLNSAQEAEKENMQLVVFKIPNEKAVPMANGEAVEHIEKYLQDKFQ